MQRLQKRRVNQNLSPPGRNTRENPSAATRVGEWKCSKQFSAMTAVNVPPSERSRCASATTSVCRKIEASTSITCSRGARVPPADRFSTHPDAASIISSPRRAWGCSMTSPETAGRPIRWSNHRGRRRSARRVRRCGTSGWHLSGPSGRIRRAALSSSRRPAVGPRARRRNSRRHDSGV